MIPVMNITAWSKVAPWAEQRQIEQDLIISRAIVDLFQLYMDAEGHQITRAKAEERMFQKLANPGFLQDISPLLTPDEAAKLTEDEMSTAFSRVFDTLIGKLPGNPWKRTEEMNERFDIGDLK